MHHPLTGQGCQFLGNLSGAALHYEKALPALRQDVAMEGQSKEWRDWAISTAADTHYNHAAALHQLQRTDEAAFHFLECASIQPSHAKAKEAIMALGLTPPPDDTTNTAEEVAESIGAEAAAAMGLGESMF